MDGWDCQMGAVGPIACELLVIVDRPETERVENETRHAEADKESQSNVDYGRFQIPVRTASRIESLLPPVGREFAILPKLARRN